MSDETNGPAAPQSRPTPAAAHLTLALGAFTMIRLVMGRSLGSPQRPAPATDDDTED